MTKKKEAKLSSISGTQQFQVEYWNNWNNELIESKSVEKILEEIVNRVSEIVTVTEAYAIKHDKDELELYDSETETFYSEFKAEHIHFLLKFSDGATLSQLAEAIGLEQQYLEKARSGRYGYDNLLAYLIHAKDSDKYQYPPKKVITLKGKDFLGVYKERFANWFRGRLKKEVKKHVEEIDVLVADIFSEKVTKDDILLNPKLMKLYAYHKTKINEAFMTLGEVKSLRTKKALENNEFKKSIFFVYGTAGLGKSELSKELSKQIVATANHLGQRWSSVLTAGTNIFDEVNGEEILILDDVRGESLTASDWLKLLDPYNISPISARYHNRMGSARVIIITSTKHPLEFFYNTKGNEREDLSQYLRRFDSLVTLRHVDDKTYYHHSFPKKVNRVRKKIPNTVFETTLDYDFIGGQKLTKEQMLEQLMIHVSINNCWDFNNIKTSSEDTLESNSDEVNDSAEEN